MRQISAHADFHGFIFESTYLISKRALSKAHVMTLRTSSCARLKMFCAVDSIEIASVRASGCVRASAIFVALGYRFDDTGSKGV